jgi:N6-adenosine-specific RNA methylase IME4
MKFQTIIADPAWDYELWAESGAYKSPVNHYPVSSLETMSAIPLQLVTDKDAVLLMWCTWPMMAQGMALMQAWGFKFKTGIPWLKLTKDMLPRIGTGYHARACSEYIMIGTKGSPRAPEPFERMPGIILARQGAHSAKPDDAYTFAELYDGPYLEIFARRYRDGWVSLGNELDGLDLSESLLRVAADKTLPVVQKVQPLLDCFMPQGDLFGVEDAA